MSPPPTYALPALWQPYVDDNDWKLTEKSYPKPFWEAPITENAIFKT